MIPYTPVNIGDHSRDADEEAAVPPTQVSTCVNLCDNCMHRLVCGVVVEIKKIGAPFGAPIAVGFCPFHLPAFEDDDAKGPIPDSEM